MAFERVVEVFPPIFPHAPRERTRIRLAEEIDSFVEGVAGIRPHFDTILVASLKRQGIARLSTVESSVILRERLGIEVAPVIVVRDYSRREFLSTILTVAARGLPSMMLAWGDEGTASRTTDGYSALSEAIADASSVLDKASSEVRILAPVDLRGLRTTRGLALARSRLSSGASLLLAQPPTVDPGENYTTDRSLVDKAGLKSKVLLGVFPFKGLDDLRQCESQFRWKFPKDFESLVSQGRSAVLEAQARLVEKMVSDARPGIYVSTRGDLSVASAILG